MFGMTWPTVLLACAPWIFGLSGVFYLGLRAVRALERRATGRTEMAGLEERTLRLEESVSSLSDQLQQLSDGQEFTAKLLGERK